jgi:hypothetical protein
VRFSCNKEESDIEWYQEIKINQLPNITYIKKNPQSSLKTHYFMVAMPT